MAVIKKTIEDLTNIPSHTCISSNDEFLIFQGCNAKSATINNLSNYFGIACGTLRGNVELFDVNDAETGALVMRGPAGNDPNSRTTLSADGSMSIKACQNIGVVFRERYNNTTGETFGCKNTRENIVMGTCNEFVHPLQPASSRTLCCNFDNNIMIGTENKICYGRIVVPSEGLYQVSRFSPSMVTGNVIAGGKRNSIHGRYQIIDGGSLNVIHSLCHSKIGGGLNNAILGTLNHNTAESFNPDFSIIGGGANNVLRGQSCDSIIAGGRQNSIICSEKSVIGGGNCNTIDVCSPHSIIAGGKSNTIKHSDANSNPSCLKGGYSVILGGSNNCIATDSNKEKPNVIVGGSCNIIEGQGGSLYNHPSGSFIGGGRSQKIGCKNDNITGNHNTMISNFASCIMQSECSTAIGNGGSKIRGQFSGFSQYAPVTPTKLNVMIGNSSTYMCHADTSAVIASQTSRLVSSVAGAAGIHSRAVIMGGAQNTMCATNNCSILRGNSMFTTDFGFIKNGCHNTIVGSTLSQICEGSKNTIIASCNACACNVDGSTIIGMTNINAVSSNTLHINGLYIKGLMTENPGIPGVIWNDNGTLKVGTQS